MYGIVVKLVLVPLIVGALAITGYTSWFAGVSLRKEINKEPQSDGDTARMPVTKGPDAVIKFTTMMPDPKKKSPGWITKFTTKMPSPELPTNELNGGAKFMTEMPFSRGIKLTTKNPGPLEPCRTQECLKLDKHLVQRMDQTINPCDNFYGFVCKNPQRNTKDEFIVSNNTIRSRLQSMFNNSKYSPNPNEPLNFAKQFYNLCMKQDLNGNLTELKNMINSVGGWSLLKSDWNEKQFSLANFYGKSVEMGYLPNSLFSIDIFPHPQITNKKIITIRRPHFNQSWYGWPLDIVTYDRIDGIESFSNKLLTKVAFKFEAPLEEILLNRFHSIFGAKEISEAYEPESEFSVLKVSELESKSPGIGWREILLAVFKPKDISPEDEILVECEQCLVNLASALKKMNTTLLADNLIWHLIQDNIIDNNFEVFGDIVFDHSYRLYQKFYLENVGFKEDYCSFTVASLFRKLVNYDYAQKYFDQSLKLKLKELISHLKVWLASNIRASTYLDADTKKAAIEKLSSMNFYSPYNEETNDRNKIYQYYKDLKFNPNATYFQSLINFRKYLISKTIASLDEKNPIKVSNFKYWKNTVEYDERSNALFVSAGILENSTFTNALPNYYNYALLGSMIGREMLRGFTLKGRLYDNTSKRRDWWNSQSKEEQDRRARCYIDEYKKYNNKGTIDKKLEAEIIYDSGSVKFVYEGYVNLHNSDGEDRQLPTFQNKTNRQMFWIMYASRLCAKEPSEEEVHDSPSVRINAAVSSSNEFAGDFQCGNKTEVNSAQKCNLW